MSLNSGAAFIADAERNLDSAANLPVKLCTSFSDFGCFIDMMDGHFSGFASIPQLVNMKPSNFPASSANAHLAGLSHIWCSRSFPKAFFKFGMRSSSVLVLINISST
ncbi:hypothetical protein PIB30_080763 [Stylosanthes scabra]|uniref:Uncharacterized protein n=1 Tax=Stylosanthes scabra TaxID=79078 RepID=A0ABU6QSZ1_9FABA|nr:hypothetical protein [Stylosanthes scabra]